MSSFESSTHRLAGSTGQEGGGLIIKPKRQGTDPESFKKPSAPRGSLLGLDVLARKKREQRGEDTGFTEKRPRLEEEGLGNYERDVRISFGKTDHLRDRQYRSSRLETPSHPGGVSDEALERIQSRLKRDQRHGVFATSKDEARDKMSR